VLHAVSLLSRAVSCFLCVWQGDLRRRRLRARHAVSMLSQVVFYLYLCSASCLVGMRGESSLKTAKCLRLTAVSEYRGVTGTRSVACV